jgi:hypothetical protein
VSAALLSGFLALLYALDRYDLEPSLLRLARVPSPVVYGAVAAAAFGCAVVPPRRRRLVLLAASLVAAPLVLGAWAIAWLGYASIVIAAVRARIPLAARIAIAIAAWAVIPVARIVWLDGAAQADTIALSIVWAGELYSALYLAVEREREPVERRSGVIADAFYLLAPPRLIAPFFQPISPRQLARSERAAPSSVLLWRAAGLAGYAAAVAVVATLLGEALHHVHSRPLVLAIRFVHWYARATQAIFTAIAVFRLLGFHLPSGFRAPFLSRSFAEFFRRFNHYVRDAVLSVFYYPLLGRLRHGRSPRAATILSAYVAIIIGSFALHDLLVPMATTIAPMSSLGYFIDPVRVVAMLGLWTLIIVPTAGIAPRRPVPRSRLRVTLEIAAFNVVYLALWYAQDVGRGLGRGHPW